MLLLEKILFDPNEFIKPPNKEEEEEESQFHQEENEKNEDNYLQITNSMIELPSLKEKNLSENITSQRNTMKNLNQNRNKLNKNNKFKNQFSLDLTNFKSAIVNEPILEENSADYDEKAFKNFMSSKENITKKIMVLHKKQKRQNKDSLISNFLIFLFHFKFILKNKMILFFFYFFELIIKYLKNLKKITQLFF